jgi:hypothetical protein
VNPAEGLDGLTKAGKALLENVVFVVGAQRAAPLLQYYSWYSWLRLDDLKQVVLRV